MTRRLLNVLNDYDKAYAMFTNDDVNDQSVYEDMLSRVVSTRDLLKINRAYFEYIKLYKEREQTADLYKVFKRSINSIMYRDTSTGLVVPLFEIMYLLKIGYTIETVIRTVATFPESVQPIISDKKCESVCLSLLYPVRKTNINLNAIHVEPDVWNMSDNLDLRRERDEVLINTGETIIRKERAPQYLDIQQLTPGGMEYRLEDEPTQTRSTIPDTQDDPFSMFF